MNEDNNYNIFSIKPNVFIYQQDLQLCMIKKKL
jgi:hypothetical protein